MNISTKKKINAILFFANKANDHSIGRLKLMKLLWLADRIHLNKFGRTILEDKYYALPKGPIPSETKDLSKTSLDNIYKVSDYLITAIKEFDPNFFSRSDVDIMNFVWEKYGNMDRHELTEFSHCFPEWQRFEKELKDKNSPNSYEIVTDDFFLAPDCGGKEIDYTYNPEESELSRTNYRTFNSLQSILLD